MEKGAGRRWTIPRSGWRRRVPTSTARCTESRTLAPSFVGHFYVFSFTVVRPALLQLARASRLAVMLWPAGRQRLLQLECVPSCVSTLLQSIPSRAFPAGVPPPAGRQGPRESPRGATCTR